KMSARWDTPRQQAQREQHVRQEIGSPANQSRQCGHPAMAGACNETRYQRYPHDRDRLKQENFQHAPNGRLSVSLLLFCPIHRRIGCRNMMGNSRRVNNLVMEIFYFDVEGIVSGLPADLAHPRKRLRIPSS
ncbi:MAG: hypothetical protein ACK4E4_05560, partial [Rhodocyclaceae bacterium]